MISCNSDGWIEAVAPGRATVYVNVISNPELSTSFEVIVLGDVTFSGLENDTMKAGTTAQLVVDGGFWTTEDLPVNYSNYYDPSCDYSIDENGVITAFNPGEYNVWIDIYGMVAREYCFTVERDEEYFYSKYPEITLYAGQSICPEIWTNLEFASIAGASSDTDVVTVDSDRITAVAPGTATITFEGVYEDDSRVPCENTLTVNVLEAVVPEFTANVNRVIHVGETVEVWIDCQNSSSYHPDWHCESSDESILSVSEGSFLTGNAPGEVTLTTYANYGDKASEVSFTVYVIE